MKPVAGQKPPEKQTLRNLILHRKVCNHPSLVASELPEMFQTDSSVKQDYAAAGKLLGLVEVLQ